MVKNLRQKCNLDLSKQKAGSKFRERKIAWIHNHLDGSFVLNFYSRNVYVLPILSISSELTQRLGHERSPDGHERSPGGHPLDLCPRQDGGWTGKGFQDEGQAFRLINIY